MGRRISASLPCSPPFFFFFLISETIFYDSNDRRMKQERSL